MTGEATKILQNNFTDKSFVRAVTAKNGANDLLFASILGYLLSGKFGEKHVNSHVTSISVVTWKS